MTRQQAKCLKTSNRLMEHEQRVSMVLLMPYRNASGSAAPSSVAASCSCSKHRMEAGPSDLTLMHVFCAKH